MGFENFKKIIGLTAVGIGTAGAVEAQGPLNKTAEEDFASTGKNKIEYTKTTDRNKPGARKVSEVPEGYVPDGKEGQKEFYKKVTSDQKSVEMAISGGPQGDNSKFLIEQLQKGVTKEELVKKGHATAEGIKKFEKYYVPSSSEDRVYIEPSKETKKADPYAAYAVKGEGVYLPGVSGHNTGQIYYLSMQSKNIQESGMANTGNEDFIIRFEDANGKSLGISVRIKAEDKNKYFGTSNHLIEGAHEALLKLAEEQRKSGKEIQQIGPDFSTRTDTVKL